MKYLEQVLWAVCFLGAGTFFWLWLSPPVPSPVPVCPPIEIYSGDFHGQILCFQVNPYHLSPVENVEMWITESKAITSVIWVGRTGEEGWWEAEGLIIQGCFYVHVFFENATVISSAYAEEVGEGVIFVRPVLIPMVQTK